MVVDFVSYIEVFDKFKKAIFNTKEGSANNFGEWKTLILSRSYDDIFSFENKNYISPYKKGSFEIVVLTKNLVWIVAVVEELLFRKLSEHPKPPLCGFPFSSHKYRLKVIL